MKPTSTSNQASWIFAGKLLNQVKAQGWTSGEYQDLNLSLEEAQLTGYDSGSLTQQQAGNLPVIS